MSAISTLPVSQYTSSLSSGSTTTSVARSTSGNLSRNAVSLAADAGVVAILGGGNGSTTYSASGIFDTLATAGSNNQDTAQPSVASSDQNLVDSPDQPAAGTNAASLASLGQSAPADLSSSYAAILKANPSAAAMVTAYSMNQSIISTFSTYA